MTLRRVRKAYEFFRKDNKKWRKKMKYINKDAEIAIKAILARFNGDREKAIDYCLYVADNHRAVSREYLHYRSLLIARDV